MRITNMMMSNSMLTRINKNMNSLDTYYTQMSSGKKIQMPSEDPIVASRALKLRNMVSSTEQYNSNADQGLSWMEATESAFSNMNSILTTMSELSVQGASDQYKEDDRKKILNQFNSLVSQLETELNSTYMGRYLFSGYKTDKPAIIQDAITGKKILNSEVYGDNDKITPSEGRIKLEVGVNNYIEINSLTTETYTPEMYDELHYFEKVYDYMEGTLSQEDLDTYFGGKAFDDLSETEVVSFDNKIRSEFESMIAKVNSYNDSITEQQTNLGVRMNRITLIQERLGDDKVNYTNLMSKNEDVNYADVAMKFNVANATYQASLKTGMTITQLTLADFL